MLAEHLPRPLRDPALHLAFHDLMIDDVAGVVHRSEAHDFGDAGLGLDLDLGDMAAVRESHAEPAFGLYVERLRRARVLLPEPEEPARAVRALDPIGAARAPHVGSPAFPVPRS